MLKRKLSAVLIALSLSFAVTAAHQTASASEGGMFGDGLFPVIALFSSPIWLTTQIAPLVYLAKKKHMPSGWQIAGYINASLQLTFSAVLYGTDAPIGGTVFLSIGALTLTLNLLAAKLNKNKPKTVAFTPILLKDSGGNLAPGVGFSLLSF